MFCDIAKGSVNNSSSASCHICKCGYISNKVSFRQEHPGVSDGPDGSDGTSYPLTDNQMGPVTQATGRVAYLICGGYFTMPLIPATQCVVYYTRRPGIRLPSLCIRNVVTYTHHQNDTCVNLFAGIQLCCSHSAKA